MTFFDELVEIYGAYLDSLDAGEPDVKLPKRVRSGKKGFVYASSLGLCPLKAKLEHDDAPYPFPDLVSKHRLDTRHKMHNGTLAALPWQKALIKRYGPKGYEVSVESKELGVRGRIDFLIPGNKVLEIKNVNESAAQWKGYEMLKPYQIMQTMVYGLMLDTHDLYILSTFRDGFKLWEFNWNLYTGKYEILGTQMVKGKVTVDDNPLYSPTEMQLVVEINKHVAYLQDRTTANPYPDYLNQEYRWQCVTINTYANSNGGKGTYSPACPYWCHTDTVERMEYVKGEQGQYIPLNDIF